MADVLVASETVPGFPRPDGTWGIRNHVVVMAAADNVNPVVRRLGEALPDAVAVPATFGRGQLGRDAEIAHRVTAQLASHPNVFATLVISFEPESGERIRALAAERGETVQTLSLLECGGMSRTLVTAEAILRERLDDARSCSPDPMPAHDLLVGLECGGSDGTSGLVANPAIGRLVDELRAGGAGAIFSEPIELVGCEEMLAARSASSEAASDIRALIAAYRRIADDAGVDLVGTNPTADNIAGGLSSIEEKSLGAVAKSGSTAIDGVLDHGERPPRPGLWLMDAPAAAVENLTALSAAGCQAILFATGSVNPSGAALTPTIKICANPCAARRMVEHVDVDLSDLLDRPGAVAAGAERIGAFLDEVLAGRRTAAETLGYLETRISRYGLSV